MFLGWLINPISTFLREIIGRKLEELLLDADMSLYSQHVVGLRNTIADDWSYNVQQSNSQLLLFIYEKYGKDTPQNLRIVENAIHPDAGVTVSQKDNVDDSFKKWEKFSAEANIDTSLKNFDEFQKFEVFSVWICVPNQT